ncbi:hypothetical protein SZ54_4896 [Rhizobium sp. UR51a]|nr:hypothetical protein SZ54_4896 [Rhizobium sp. UR51a]
MVEISTVADETHRTVADFINCLFYHVRSPSRDNDLGAFLCEELSGRLADPAITAGYYNDFATQMLHVSVSH